MTNIQHLEPRLCKKDFTALQHHCVKFLKSGTNWKENIDILLPPQVHFTLADVPRYSESVVAICVLLSVLSVVSIPFTDVSKLMGILMKHILDRNSQTIFSWSVLRTTSDILYVSNVHIRFVRTREAKKFY